MGAWASRLWQSLSSLVGSDETRILILGLDNAGKTTILRKFTAGSTEQATTEDGDYTIPTIGFNVETVRYQNVRLQLWDLGGQTSIRPYWRCYFPNTNGICFVVDAADPERLDEAAQELGLLLEDADLRNVPVAVMSNKHDLSRTTSHSEMAQRLRLARVKDR